MLTDYPPAVAVDVEPLLAHEAQHRQAEAPGGLDGQAAAPTAASTPMPAAAFCTSSKLTRPLTSSMCACRGSLPASSANHLVEGIVATHVFAQQEQLAGRGKQAVLFAAG